MNYSLIFNLKNTSAKVDFIKTVSLIFKKYNWKNTSLKQAQVVVFFGGDGLLLENLNSIVLINPKIKFLLFKMSKIAFYYQFNLNQFEEVIQNFNHLKVLKIPLIEILANQEIFYALNEVKIINMVKPIEFKIQINETNFLKTRASGLLATSFLGASGFAKILNGPLFLTTKNNLWTFKVLFPIKNFSNTTIENFFVLGENQKITFKSKYLKLFHLIFDNNCRFLNGNEIMLNYNKIFINILAQSKFELLSKYQNIFLKK